MTGKFFSVSLKERKIVWDYFDESNAECFSSPAAAGNRVFFGTRGNFLRCLSREDGKLLWTFTAKEGIDTSPVVVSGSGGERIFFGSSDGKLYGLNTEDGKKIFEYEAGSALTGSPAISDNKIVFGTAGGLVFCFAGEE